MTGQTETTQAPGTADTGQTPRLPLLTLFRRFLGFGLHAWGGPVAQIAMLRSELVEREHWISPHQPGPCRVPGAAGAGCTRALLLLRIYVAWPRGGRGTGAVLLSCIGVCTRSAPISVSHPAQTAALPSSTRRQFEGNQPCSCPARSPEGGEPLHELPLRTGNLAWV